MAEDNQIVQLKLNSRNDEEFTAVNPRIPRREKTNKCVVYVLAGTAIFSAIFLAFALVVRPRTPDLELSFVSVKNLVYTNNNVSFSSLNMTLEAELSIRNTNFGSFKFENATASVLYGGQTVGKGIIGEGLLKARDKENIKVKVDVRSYRFSDTEKLSRDIDSGILKLQSLAKFSGKVQWLQIVEKLKTASVSCSMSLNLKSHFQLQDLICS
uniref:Late embryogenesis abundant protein LEA-2 subgroup domain-containing protein n=1 Tax=Manihot esculenta TaxID=3983 RepID=A0A2C9WCJ4_MANES